MSTATERAGGLRPTRRRIVVRATIESFDKDAFARRLAANIQRARWDRDIPQHSLAEAIGCSGNAVKRWETGMIPDSFYVERIADALGITIDDLFNYNDRRK